MKQGVVRWRVFSRRSLRTAVWIAVGAPLVLIVIGASLALYTPGWYQSQAGGSVDPQAVRDDLRDAAQGFSDALMQQGVFDLHLSEVQLNQWLAMRAEIYPMIERQIPPEWREPAIRFREGAIRLAATYHGAGPGIVLSLDLVVSIESNEICLKVVGGRAGALVLPMPLFGRVLSRPIDIPPGKAWRGSPEIRGDLRSGLRIGTRAVWPNGDRLYRIDSVSVRRKWLDLKIESLGALHHSRRSVQSEESRNPFADKP